MANNGKNRWRSQIPEKIELGELFDRLPPHDIVSEMRLLGSMIIDGRVIGDVVQILQGEDDFYKPAHSMIYATLIELYDVQGAVDGTLVHSMLAKKGQLDKVGGEEYLVQLVEAMPTAIHAVHYAQQVRDRALLRKLIDSAGHMLHQAYESAEPAGEIIDRAEKLIFDIHNQQTSSDPQALRDLLDETFEKIEQRKSDGSTITGLASGFRELDEMLSGLQKQEMIIIAARPSMGKTAFALNIAEHIAVDNRKPLALFSLEMSKQQLVQRLLCARSGVDSQRLRRNTISDADIQKLLATADELKNAPIYIDDTPGLSVLQMRAKARRLAAKYEIQAIVIDYLQLLSDPSTKDQGRTQEVSSISRAIKALAREINVPVVCLSQLNRNPEGRESKTPMLSDLRESGSIEQDADVVMMLHREDYYHKADAEHQATNEAHVIVAKQRNGPTGMVKMLFFDSTMRFENVAHGMEQMDPGAMDYDPTTDADVTMDPPF